MTGEDMPETLGGPGVGAPFGTGSCPSGRAADGVSPVPASIPSADDLRRENATLRDDVRALGKIANVCTYPHLRERCEDCCCGRGETL